MTSGGNTFNEVLILGGTFMIIAAIGDSLYAVSAGKAGTFLSRGRIRGLEIVSGCFLVGGGVWMALKGR